MEGKRRLIVSRSNVIFPTRFFADPKKKVAGNFEKDRIFLRVKTSQYFVFMKERPDRAWIKEEWIEHVILNPTKKEIQADGRVRLWSKIKEAGGKYLRVVLLDDQETVHNAFFDRTFKETPT